MKLYDFTLAPNPRRVRVFLAEKGIVVPLVQVNLRERQQFTPEFVKANPNCTVPLLELDDGTQIAESVAICRYFEELQPQPPLMGIDPTDKALVEMWNRRVEIEGFLPSADALRNTSSAFEGRALPGMPDGVPQIPALAERGRATAGRLFDKLNRQLSDRDFVTGSRFTIADITALVTIDFAARAKISALEGRDNLQRWHTRVSARPSAAA
jgi:glutathione S-transferase